VRRHFSLGCETYALNCGIDTWCVETMKTSLHKYVYQECNDIEFFLIKNVKRSLHNLMLKKCSDIVLINQISEERGAAPKI
jgi:hypothetical protein